MEAVSPQRSAGLFFYERRVCVTRFNQTLQRHEGGSASGICQVHCFGNSVAWDVYWKSWPPFPLLLCLLSFPQGPVVTGALPAAVQGHDSWSDLGQRGWDTSGQAAATQWLLYPAAKPFPSPSEIVVQNTSCPHCPICARGLVVLAPKF